MKVLVAEDNKESRYLLETLLKGYGHEVTAVTNGAEALEQALAQPPDIIVSDIMMPEMDGFQLCQECKQKEQLKNIPFVFYTATYTSDEDEKFALSLGADAFILKPTEPDIFVRKLSEEFKKARSRPLAPDKIVPLEPALYLTEYSKRIVAKLEGTVAELETEIDERKRVEEILRKRTYDLNERVKELDCLHNITTLVGRPGISLEEILQGIADLIPFAWQYHEMACARIIVDKEEFKTANFKETKWRLFSNIISSGEPLGSVEVCYLKESPESGERTFLKEEGKLIHAVADRIRRIVERMRAENELKQSYEKLQESLEGTINALATTAEWRDPYTAGHQQRVTRLACAIAEEMNLSAEQNRTIYMSAMIHDIGKINVPSEILSKPGQISELEFKIIQTHPQVGYDILKEIEFPWPIAQIVLQHHERLDGSGYPQGLEGKAILLEARILGIADVIEAMSSHRPYRPALGIDKALEEISQNKGILYDPEVVDTCLRLFTEKDFKLQ